MKMNKRGLTNEIWIVIILFIVILMSVFAYWAYSSTAPLVTGLSSQITTQVKQTVDSTSPNSTLANVTAISVNTTNGILGLGESFVYIGLIGIFLGFLGICYYTRTFKWLSVVWILLVIVLVFISMILSNSYQDSKNTATDLNKFYTTWGTNDFLMSNLPYIVGFFGFICGIILFAISALPDESGGLE